MLSEVWQNRGPFPGIGSVLQYLGFEAGTAFQREVLVPLLDRGEDPWEYTRAILEGRRACQQARYANALVKAGERWSAYAVTSHSSQGQTADRVLIHVDSAQGHGELLNSRMAYVSVSRAQYDVKMYTNDANTLGFELSRDVTKTTALDHPEAGERIKPQSVGLDISLGLSLG